MLYWRYRSDAHKAAGALVPEILRLELGRQDHDSPFRTGNDVEVDRAIHRGYRVKPSDCPAIRNISRFGYFVRCPGSVQIERQETYARERELRPGSARFGYAVLRGDTWPGSDSDLIVSWITGSEYVKIQTGIDVLFPCEHQLYQGPLPNADLMTNSTLPVAAGLEYFTRSRSTSVNGDVFGVANLNILIRLPPVGKTWTIERGQPIAWFFDLPRHAGEMQGL